MRFKNMGSNTLLMIREILVRKRICDCFADVCLTSHPLATIGLFFGERLLCGQESVSNRVDFACPDASGFPIQITGSSHSLVIFLSSYYQASDLGQFTVRNNVPSAVS